MKVKPVLGDWDGSGLANDPLPLGIHVGAPPPGAFVSINGLTAGARLTSGKRIGPSEWRVSATEISGVSVIPPDGRTSTEPLRYRGSKQ